MNTQPKSNIRTIVKPINYLFQLYQSKNKVEIWIFENDDITFEGTIIGFDEFMNMVLDECIEKNKKKNTINNLGRIMLKGDNITLIRAI